MAAGRAGRGLAYRDRVSFNDNARLDPSQVQDQRGRRSGGGGMIVGGGGIGLVILVVSLLLGVDPTAILDSVPTDTVPLDSTSQQTISECKTGADANRRPDCRIVGFVDSVQLFWTDELARRGKRYTPASTVLFTDVTQAGCGTASAEMGPFYCPVDQKVYLDLSFFQELQTRFGAKGGPFAEGYVIAHEYGHHVQDLLGLLSNDSRTGPTSSSVKQELQADCFAGVWAKHAAETGYLQPPTAADIASALDAAAAVGDDRIQRASSGRVAPESWTHGSAAQRQQWFSTGYQTGDYTRCTP
jgi:predicted metalloprotease